MLVNINSCSIICVILLLLICCHLSVTHSKSIVSPSRKAYFPSSFSSKVYIEASRNFNYDIYYDYETSKYKIDSYGVPLSVLLSKGPILRGAFDDPYVAKRLISIISSMQSQGGLYSFIFDYEKGVLYSIFPGSCVISKLKKLPSLPTLSTDYENILGSATYIGSREWKGELVDHFIRDYVVTQIDYFQSQSKNGSLPEPRRLTIADESFTFFDVELKRPDPSVFIPPTDCRPEY